MNISKLTNSEIGSRHWYNTLLGNISRIGEYLADNAPDTITSQYGGEIKQVANELYENYQSITEPGKGKVESAMVEMLEMAVVVEAKKAIAQRDELLEALKEVVRISDRKRDAWDKAKEAIEKAEL